MSSQPAIEIDHLWKTYRVQAPGPGHSGWRPAKADFHALSDVTFAVPEGAVLGIVGSNGAGKSTLLKILSRVTDPTRGRVVLRGRTASILEIGTGFHPELTGMENVYLNGAVHGLSRRDIRTRLPAILEFAEIGDWVHEPAKHYSSGMYLRLAFSVAAHLDPDIMIIDEALAVGDQKFRSKCFGRMREVAGEGRTVVLVSHDAPSVASLCTMAAFLKQGALVMTGPPESVIEAYHASTGVASGVVHRDTRDLVLEALAGTYESRGSGRAVLRVEATFRALRNLECVSVDASVTDAWGRSPLQVLTSLRAGPTIDLQAGDRAAWRAEFAVPELRPGSYTAGFSVQARSEAPLLQMSGMHLCAIGGSPWTPEFASSHFHAMLGCPVQIAWTQKL